MRHRRSNLCVASVGQSVGIDEDVQRGGVGRRKKETYGIEHARRPRLSIHPDRLPIEILRDLLVEGLERVVVR